MCAGLVQCIDRTRRRRPRSCLGCVVEGETPWAGGAHKCSRMVADVRIDGSRCRCGNEQVVASTGVFVGGCSNQPATNQQPDVLRASTAALTGVMHGEQLQGGRLGEHAHGELAGWL